MGRPVLSPPGSHSMSRVRAPNSSVLLGERLLQGWRMLAECCPDCAVPLMQQRGGVTSSCVSCNQEFSVASQLPVPDVSLEAHHLPHGGSPAIGDSHHRLANGTAQLTTQRVGSNALGQFNSIASNAGVRLPPYPSLPPISTSPAEPTAAETPSGGAEVGLEELDTESFRQRELQLDAQRLAALADIAQEMGSLSTADASTSPAGLLPASVAPPGNQVETGPALSRNSDVTGAFPQSRSQGVQTSPARAEGPGVLDAVELQTSEETFKWPYGNRQNEDASKEIADKLLRGWTLLAQHCPRCLNPLLADRVGKIFCPGCQLWAVSGSDPAVAAANEPAASLPAIASSVPCPPSPSKPWEGPSSSEEPSGRRGVAAEEDESGRAKGEGMGCYASLGAARASSGSAGLDARLDEPEAIRLAAKTVLAKLMEAEEALRRTPVSDSETCKQLVGLIKKCSSTLKLLRRT